LGGKKDFSRNRRDISFHFVGKSGIVRDIRVNRRLKSGLIAGE